MSVHGKPLVSRASVVVLTASVLTAGVVLSLASKAHSFDMTIHEDITEDLLRSRGFDEDSADEVGDSNFYTDLFEASNAAAHADGNQLGAASQRLIDKRQRVGDSLDACRRRDALDALGEAFHTVQDIFSHSNSVDNGHPVSLLNLSNGSAPCNSAANFAPTGLVTGYFSTFGFFTGNQCRGMPANMCCHRELNKDNGDAPNGDRHGDARDAAVAASGTYLGLVEDSIRTRFPGERGTQLLKMLKRKQRTMMFVIDDTGSMGNDIAGVKAAANAFLDQLVAGDEAPTLGLVSFKDNVTNRGLTCDIATLRAQINALFASGGGDCPEAMNAALLSAIQTFPAGRGDIQLRGGRILLATDASARDPGLGPTVADQAFLRGINIDAILTGDCVPEDGLTAPRASDEVSSENEDAHTTAAAPAPSSHTGDPLTSPSARTYLRAITEQTGGVLFNVSRLEVDDVVPTLLELSEPDSTIVLTRRVAPASGTPLTVEVPVDDTLSEVTFMVTASTAAGLPTVTLRRPDGSVVLPTDPGVTRRQLSSVISYLVNAPAVGLWRVTLEGQSRVVVRAFGPSPLRLNALRLFLPAGATSRPEQELPLLDGQPVAGATLIAEARLTNAPSEATLRLLRQDGALIQDLASTLTERRVRATLTVPGETFLLETVGRTPAGNAFVREYAVPVIPRLVGIRTTPDVAVASPGTSAAFTVTVTNASAVRAGYTLQVTTSLPWPVSPIAPFAVDPGASVDLALSVTVPSGTPEGTRNDLTLRVQDTAAPLNRNTTSVAVLAGPTNRPPECGGASASPSRLWPPNHQFVDIDVSGVTDPDGDPVSIAVTGITQDEAVNAPGSGNTAPDGEGVGASSARVRAERAGSGDGRVYAIAFSASDGNGGACSGSVAVGVPHSSKGTAVDSGQLYDSTVIP